MANTVRGVFESIRCLARMRALHRGTIMLTKAAYARANLHEDGRWCPSRKRAPVFLSSFRHGPLWLAEPHIVLRPQSDDQEARGPCLGLHLCCNSNGRSPSRGPTLPGFTTSDAIPCGGAQQSSSGVLFLPAQTQPTDYSWTPPREVHFWSIFLYRRSQPEICLLTCTCMSLRLCIIVYPFGRRKLQSTQTDHDLEA